MNWLPLVTLQHWLGTVREMVVVAIAGPELQKAYREALKAREEALAAQFSALAEASRASMLEAHAYLRGVSDGRQQAFDAVERQLRERMGGAQDLINEDDVMRAKKGMLH